MNHFRIGHYTDLKRGTGCTVILCPDGNKASGCARGISPGTREFALLSPFRKVEEIQGLLLTGGSAFGLDAAAGVMRYLRETGKGHPTPFAKIPIVPAAVIFDLLVVDSTAFPAPENAYEACRSARTGNDDQGTVGAGTGATVGKWAGPEHIMKGGVGQARLNFDDVWVHSLAVVNPVGDIVDEKGAVLAGARQNGRFLAEKDPRQRWKLFQKTVEYNTVLVAVMTNARLSKQQLYYLSERAHNGIVKAVVPAHTSFDGDVVFSVATGEVETAIDFITEMTVEAVRQSIVQSVRHATALGGIPALNSL
jgi:L-aminopeptidase/D-esterase-like protein